MARGNLHFVFLLSLLLFCGVFGAESQVIFEETSGEKESRMEWWREARFGMFIHWGLYSMPARHEWVKKYEAMLDEDYRKYFELFEPDLYDPEEWAKLAKEAGMKYFVVTTKHHEGFCLWDSEYTDYKSTNTPWGKDIIKPMVDAFRREGLGVGFYYSLLDWHHPSYVPDRQHPRFKDAEFMSEASERDMTVYQQYIKDQVGELLTDFGKIDMLFCDFSFVARDGTKGKGREDWDSVNLARQIRRLQPEILINDRLDLMDYDGGWDFRTPEQFLPQKPIMYEGRAVAWETCQTFSGSWGYHRDEQTWKSTRQLLELLIDVVSKNGNLLLNVGPTGRGAIDDRAKERLRGMGKWLKYNGRSIYGCGAAPAEFECPAGCLFTYNAKMKRLYVHLLRYPIKELHLAGLAGKFKYAQFLHDASELKFVKRQQWQAKHEAVNEDILTVQLPVSKPDVEIPVVEMFLN
jgi:alpha-L-fucosidase